MRITQLGLVASSLIVGAALAADDVGVYVGNPRISRYIEAAEVLRQQLPGAQARWNAVAATGATFTMAFLPGADEPRDGRPCAGVPIRVKVERSQVISTSYAISTSNCQAGTAVKISDDPSRYSLLSPQALFQEVATQVERSAHGTACVDAYFDPDFGLPTTFHEGCPWLKDSSLNIRISEIVSTRQRLVNLVVTLAGGLLVLLGLGYYHYKRLRSRQEAMPDLLLR